MLTDNCDTQHVCYCQGFCEANKLLVPDCGVLFECCDTEFRIRAGRGKSCPCQLADGSVPFNSHMWDLTQERDPVFLCHGYFPIHQQNVAEREKREK